MRASLTADGTLTITPETPVEAYALAAWLKDGKRGKHGCLAVQTEVEVPAYDFKPGKIIPWPIGTENQHIYYPTADSLKSLADATSASAGTCP